MRIREKLIKTMETCRLDSHSSLQSMVKMKIIMQACLSMELMFLQATASYRLTNLTHLVRSRLEQTDFLKAVKVAIRR